MRIICVLLIFVFSNITFSKEKSLETLKNMKFRVNEKIKLNNRNREIIYDIIFEIPNKIKKEIVFPEINKGEIYLYDGEKKIIYLPFFDEYKETKINSEENKIIQVVNNIIRLEKENKQFKNKYMKKQRQKITLDKHTNIILEKYTEVNDYILPKKINIEDKTNNFVGDIELDEIEVNKNISKETFILKQ